MLDGGDRIPSASTCRQDGSSACISNVHEFCDADRHINEEGVRHEGIVVEGDVRIGSKATILNGATIVCGAAAAAGGAVAAHDALPGAIVVGLPPRMMRYHGDRQRVSSSEAEASVLGATI